MTANRFRLWLGLVVGIRLGLEIRFESSELEWEQRIVIDNTIN